MGRLGSTSERDGQSDEDEEQRDSDAAVADATVPRTARLLDDNNGLRLFGHVR